MIERYGFIIKAQNYNHQSDHCHLDTEGFSSNIVGVSSPDEAVIVARQMIAKGIQVIELCGGFSIENRDHIINALDTDIAIGSVSFSEAELQKLERFL